jgi:hypothetical protein
VRLQRLLESFRWQGAGTTFVHVLKIALKPLIEINRFLLFETDLTQPLAPAKASIPLEMRVMTAEDIQAFADLFRARDLDAEIIDQRLARGGKCIRACSGGQLVGFHWLGFSSLWLSEIGATLRLAPGEVYSYDVVTFPDWRGNRIQPAMGFYARQYARACGCARHLTYVRADNPRSLRALARLALKQTKTVWSIRVLGRQRPILLLGAKGAESPSFDMAALTAASDR